MSKVILRALWMGLGLLWVSGNSIENCVWCVFYRKKSPQLLPTFKETCEVPALPPKKIGSQKWSLISTNGFGRIVVVWGFLVWGVGPIYHSKYLTPTALFKTSYHVEGYQTWYRGSAWLGEIPIAIMEAESELSKRGKSAMQTQAWLSEVWRLGSPSLLSLKEEGGVLGMHTQTLPHGGCLKVMPGERGERL